MNIDILFFDENFKNKDQYIADEESFIEYIKTHQFEGKSKETLLMPPSLSSTGNQTILTGSGDYSQREIMDLGYSIGKKIKVVNAIVKELRLENVSAIHSRAESLDDSFDIIITRAVASIEKLVSLTKNLFTDKKGAFIYALKGGDLTHEIRGHKTQIYPVNKWLKGSYFDKKYVVRIKVF